MTEEGREWLNSYKEIDLYLSTSRGEKTRGTSVEGDITELIDVIKAVEGAEMLKTILMEHIEVVVRGTNHRFVRLEAERRLKGNEDIRSPLEGYYGSQSEMGKDEWQRSGKPANTGRNRKCGCA
jgi:predicted ArsR family transcriptional regulator